MMVMLHFMVRPDIGDHKMATKINEESETKTPELCLTGSGNACKPRREFAGLGADARYKSRLIAIAVGQPHDDLPTDAELKKLGYEPPRLQLVPRKSMSAGEARTIIKHRGWDDFLAKREAKLNGSKSSSKSLESSKVTASLGGWAVGDKVWCPSRGVHYLGVVVKLGKKLVSCRFASGSGTEYVKEFAPKQLVNGTEARPASTRGKK
jgi:hypothetical protein